MSTDFVKLDDAITAVRAQVYTDAPHNAPIDDCIRALERLRGGSSAPGAPLELRQQMTDALAKLWDREYTEERKHDPGAPVVIGYSEVVDLIWPLIEAALRSTPTLALDARTLEAIDAVVQTVAELPDRTSPDDWPEAMLVTADELRTIMRQSFRSGDALAALRSTPPALPLETDPLPEVLCDAYGHVWGAVIGDAGKPGERCNCGKQVWPAPAAGEPQEARMQLEQAMSDALDDFFALLDAAPSPRPTPPATAPPTMKRCEPRWGSCYLASGHDGPHHGYPLTAADVAVNAPLPSAPLPAPQKWMDSLAAVLAGEAAHVPATPPTDEPAFLQAQRDWEPLVRGRAIGLGNALNLDADGVERVRVALESERIAGYCRAATAPAPRPTPPAEKEER